MQYAGHFQFVDDLFLHNWICGRNTGTADGPGTYDYMHYFSFASTLFDFDVVYNGGKLRGEVRYQLEIRNCDNGVYTVSPKRPPLIF